MIRFRPVLIGLLLIAALGRADTAADAWQQADTLFGRGAFSEGRGLLLDALEREDLTAEDRGRVLSRLAYFYERYAGDCDRALQLYEDSARLDGLEPDHPVKAAARLAIARIQRDRERYSKEDLQFRTFRIETNDPAEVTRRLSEINQFIGNNPDYPQLAQVYYYLGSHYLAAEKYEAACRAFDRALEMCPGLAFTVAAEHRRGVAYRKWVGTAIRRALKTVAGILLVLAAAGLVSARPWQRLGRRDLAGPGLVMLCWLAVFSITTWLTGRHTPVPAAGYALPVFAGSAWGQPGSIILLRLLVYGVTGVIGGFILSIGAMSIPLQGTRRVVTATAVFILFMCLAGLFFMEYCYDDALPEPPGPNGMARPGSVLFSVIREMEPYVLTDPARYAGLDVNNIDDPVLRTWVEAHVPPLPERD